MLFFMTPAARSDEEWANFYLDIWETKPKNIHHTIKTCLSTKEFNQFLVWTMKGGISSCFGNLDRYLTRIHTTDFRDPLQAKEFARYTVNINDLYFPIGTCKGVAYQLFVDSNLACALDDIEQQRRDTSSVSKLAPYYYLCIKMCDINDAKGKLQVNVPTLPISRQIRKPSDESYYSESSDEGLHILLIPAALETLTSAAFFYLGNLGTLTGSETTVLDYHVLVSLHDFSVWIQYCAWDGRFYNDGLVPHDEWDMPLTCSPFKPDDDPNWAHLPGFEGRILMAQIAKDARNWRFSDQEVVFSEIWSDDNKLPTVKGAIFDADGGVIIS